MAVTITIDLAKMGAVARYADEMRARADNLQPLYADIAERLKISIEMNFRAQGRPLKWAKLSRPRSERAKILQHTGRLKNSIQSRISASGVAVIVTVAP